MATEHLHASNGDRENAAERLRLALDEGRLDLTGYDERLQAAYAASTYGELTALLADLPGPPAVERSAAAGADGPDGPADGARTRSARTWLRAVRFWLADVSKRATG